ncbi:MAG: hypothetical protein PME_23660 [Priestia megaterium]
MKGLYFRDFDFYCLKFETVTFALSMRQLSRRAEYHQDRLVQCIKDPVLINLYEDAYGRDGDSKLDFWTRAGILEKVIDPELSAMLQAIRSQFDVFSQVINSELFESPKDARNLAVAFKKIGTRIESEKLKKKIYEIIDHENFIYIDDFINLSKHVVTLATRYWQENNEGFKITKNFTTMSWNGEDKVMNNLEFVPEKKLEWVVNTLKPWADQQLYMIGTILKEIQKDMMDESELEWDISLL